MVGHSAGSTPRASNQKDGLPRRFTLECAEAAENGELDLDGSAPQVVALAEHLVDVGLLRVPRAGHYVLTPTGRERLGQSRTGAASIKPRRRAPLLFPVALAAIAVAVLWFWLRS